MGIMPHDTPWWRATPLGRQALDGYDVILMRQDPPFDMEYITATYLLETLAHKVFNHPAAVRNAPEKLSPFLFPQFQPPTLVSADAGAIRAFHAQHPDMVLKPLHGFGGHGVFRLKAGDGNREALLEMVLGKAKSEPWVAQAFLPAVKDRELRVLLVDGAVAATIKRVPAGEDIRSNLRVGGTAQATELTAQEASLAQEVGAWARAQGIVLVGLDLIGGYLGEINVTCPTTLRTARALYGTNVAGMVWDVIGQRCRW
jgi:glutathione synthase